MRVGLTLIGMVALMGLTSCGAYTAGGPYGAGSGGGGGGGPVGSVTVGNDGRIVFISAHNGSANPAVDTVAVGGTVTWTWTNNQGISHSIESIGSPSFTSSRIMSGNGQSYSVTFTTPGTYQYDCAVHGPQMTGTIVVR
jgi:plastocyanin